jgi:hypothetical protein
VIFDIDREATDARLLDLIDDYYELEAAHEAESAAERRAFGYY